MVISMTVYVTFVAVKLGILDSKKILVIEVR